MTRYEPWAIVGAMAMRFVSEMAAALLDGALQIETRGAGVAVGILTLSILLYGVRLFVIPQSWRGHR